MLEEIGRQNHFPRGERLTAVRGGVGLEELVFNVTAQDGQNLERLEVLGLLQGGGDLLGRGFPPRL